MDIAGLNAFLIVAEEGHTTRAAVRLHLTQPAVSARIARLEESLGQQLFHRTPKGMVLTAAGRLFQQFAVEALGRLDDGRQALDQLAGLERGILAIGGGATATTYLLPPLLGAFHARHPAIRLYVREQGSAGVVEAVRSGTLDLGVVTLPDGEGLPAGAGSERLMVEPWLDDELRLIVPPGHALEGKRAFRWADLRASPLVLFEAGTAVRSLIDLRLAASATEVEIVMELRSIDSIKQMVAQGIGAAFVSRYALGDSEPGLRCADGPLQRQLAIICRADRSLSPASLAFRELMRGLDARDGA